MTIDADRHVIEPVEMWPRYLDAPFKAGAPTAELRIPAESLESRISRLGAAGLIPLPPTLLLDGRPVMRGFSEAASIALANQIMRDPERQARGAHPDAQLEEMDADGVDIAYLYPSFATYLLGIETIPVPRSEAFNRAYNSWLADYCAADPARLRGVGLIGRHDPEQMCVELKRCLDLGFCAVVLRPNPVRGRSLGHHAYGPFWSLAESEGISIAIHEGAHTQLPTAGAERFHSHFAQIATSHPLELMMAFLSLLEGGIFEAHPTLRFAFLEAGGGWVPYWLDRLDDLYTQLGSEIASAAPQAPSVYFKRQCYVSVEPDEVGLPLAAEHLGIDRLLFGTDFPHLDHRARGMRRAEQRFTQRLGSQASKDILQNNPRRFYGPS